MTGDYENAKIVAMALLRSTHSLGLTVGEVEIAAAVKKAVDLFPALALEDGVATRLARDIEAMFNVSIGSAGVLDGGGNHEDWLESRREEIDWGLSRRYLRWLEAEKGLPPAVLGRLDEVSDLILERIEDPKRPGIWDRRGMVVGSVQSGKTSNYTSVICKAADAGYKVIIVLAGMDNALRSQTQIRIDEGVIGYDTQGRRLSQQLDARIGVGIFQPEVHAQVQSLTSSFEAGDFSRTVAKQLGIVAGGQDPLILVVKKNVSILRNVTKWLTTFSPSVREEGRCRVIQGNPLLLIDDECDNASVNTKSDDPDTEPTAINRMIRNLLSSFDQSAYIGYTATPFANVFISPNSEQAGLHGEDLFPRDFIVALKRPSDYVGPSRVFGTEGDPERGLEEGGSLPIIRHLRDHEDWLPNRHKAHFDLGLELPDSLEEAILSFVLVCAARRLRGQARAHNSMLVHVTRFVNVQSQVHEAIESYLAGLKHRIRYGDGDRTPSMLNTLRSMWEGDFRKTTEALRSEGYEHQSWSQLEPEIFAAVQKIQVRSINGKSADILDYLNHESDGLSVIAVGGAKLSRGLTLEGLSVSYYLRSSKMYDTLMQMGRWFGFHNGYLDLCRLYTTKELCEWYREVALATEDLLEQFEEMALAKATPRDFGLKVMLSPSGLDITRAGARRNGTKMKVSYSGSLAETVTFDASQDSLRRNFGAVEELVRQCDAQGSVQSRLTAGGGGPVWQGVPADLIIEFLGSFKTHPNSPRANSTLLKKYVEKRNSAIPSELTNWTVALVSLSASSVMVGNHDIGMAKRSPLRGFESHDEVRIKRLLSPTDEEIGLAPETVDEAMQRTKIAWQRRLNNEPELSEPSRPDPRILRQLRGTDNGLLLLYLISPEDHPGVEGHHAIPAMGVSFPESPDALAAAVDYLVNDVYWDRGIDEE